MSMKETKEIVKSRVWSNMYFDMIAPKLEYNFNEVFKLSRLTTIDQQLKSTIFSMISLNTWCFSHLSLIFQNSDKIKNMHEHSEDKINITV